MAWRKADIDRSGVRAAGMAIPSGQAKWSSGLSQRGKYGVAIIVSPR
jgi:hypothetical protein